MAAPPHVLVIHRALPEIATSEVVSTLRSDRRTQDTAIVQLDQCAANAHELLTSVERALGARVT